MLNPISLAHVTKLLRTMVVPNLRHQSPPKSWQHAQDSYLPGVLQVVVQVQMDSSGAVFVQVADMQSEFDTQHTKFAQGADPRRMDGAYCRQMVQLRLVASQALQNMGWAFGQCYGQTYVREWRGPEYAHQVCDLQHRKAFYPLRPHPLGFEIRANACQRVKK